MDRCRARTVPPSVAVAADTVSAWAGVGSEEVAAEVVGGAGDVMTGASDERTSSSKRSIRL
jgi:hypothetical protein